MIYTGRRIGAEEALDIGLVNKICASERLIDECRAMAAMICEAGPIAIEQAKYAINYGMETDLHTGLAIESKRLLGVHHPPKTAWKAWRRFVKNADPSFGASRQGYHVTQ